MKEAGVFIKQDVILRDAFVKKTRGSLYADKWR